MTEGDWIDAGMPARVELLSGRLSQRRQRLFGCACCRALGSLLTPACLKALEAAEDLADGVDARRRISRWVKAIEAERFELHQHYNPGIKSDHNGIYWAIAAVGVAVKARPLQAGTAFVEADRALEQSGRATDEEATRGHFRLLQDFLSVPAKLPSLSPAWCTDTVMTLANQMYESRDFGAMPILADALQDAGCDSELILNHCRDMTTTHIRGCWVVDLVLGKG